MNVRHAFKDSSHTLDESGNQDDLAERARLHYFRVRARRICERQFLADDWPQRFILQPGDERGMNAREVIGGGDQKRHAVYARINSHHRARVNLDRPATADDDDAPARRKHRQVTTQINVGEHF